jgi:hypothetical protein
LAPKGGVLIGESERFKKKLKQGSGGKSVTSSLQAAQALFPSHKLTSAVWETFSLDRFLNQFIGRSIFFQKLSSPRGFVGDPKSKIFIFFGIDFMRQLQDQSIHQSLDLQICPPKFFYANSPWKELAPVISH